MNEFDKEFFDKNNEEPKILHRFNLNPKETEMKSKLIVIETPTHCFHLQENMT